ncbi:hypothetical protein ACFCX4_08345 [Kitasatospora sp. NPDC056327]|uniref:hypothetical protein n=1 Tax=Kitasatospora sp. NPDC056327 TaxID=3345785 RepID=UPI0035D730BB
MDLPYQAWQQALEAEFFGPEQVGHPTLFYVDDDVEQELRERHGLDLPLAECVGRLLRPGTDRPYGQVESQRWLSWRQDKDGIPAFLPLLASSVLAATRMVNDGHHPANAYHVRFSELLTGSEWLLNGEAFEAVSRMWQTLAEWQHGQGTARGVCTIPTAADLPRNQSRIGFPLSQALLNGGDRQALPEIFAKLRSHNALAWPLTGEDLLDTLERLGWDSRFSAGFRRAKKVPDFRPHIARLLGNLAVSWDSRVVKASYGNGRTELLVKFEAGRLSWLARVPGAEAQHISLSGGVVLERLGDTAYYAVDGLGAPDARNLNRWLQVNSSDASLSRLPTPVLALGRDDVLGTWVSASAFVPGEEYIVLAAPEAQPDVKRLLDRAASPGRARAANRLPWAPDGWAVHTAVVFDNAVTLRRAVSEIQGAVGSLQPAREPELRLTGGLRLAPLLERQLYLVGGEPSVIVPDDVSGVLLVNGHTYPALQEARRRGGPVPLAGLGLPAGLCTVSLGASSVRFTTAEGLLVPAAAERPCGFEVSGFKAAAYPAVHGNGTALSGADCGDHRATAVPEVLLSRRGADELLFAASDGRLWRIAAPGPPAWLAERLPHAAEPYLFEVELHAVGGWLLERRAGGWRGRAAGPGTPEPSSSPNAGAWAEAVLAARDCSRDPGWADYVRAAEETVR